MADDGPKPLDGALGGFEEQRLELRERHLDGIEVGTVGRHEQQARASRLNHLASGDALVAGEVIHHDHVAGPQRRGEHMADIGLEPIAVDRAVQNHRRDHTAEAEAGDEGRRFPVAVRNRHPQAFTPDAAPVRARHVRRGPGFIDEDKPRGIEIRLRLEPCPALLQDVGPILFDRVAGLFLRVRPWRWKNRERAEVDAATPHSPRRARSSSRLWSRSFSKAAMTAAR